MELKILEESNKRIVVEIDNTTIALALEKELWNDEHVKISAQKTKHPLVGNAVLVVETDGKENAKTAIVEAAKRLKKDADKLKKEIK